MKDEIKEILDDLRNKDGYVNNETILTFDEASLLLDYITNLQEGYDNAIKQSIADHKYASKKEDEVIELGEEINKLTAESTEWESKYYDLQEELEEEKRIEQEDFKTIQNLEEENERLKERCEYLQRSCDRKEEQMLDYRMEYMEQEDYKSRNKKAIEYINNNKLYDFDYDKEELFEIVTDKIAKEYLLKILQGEND